MMPKYINADKIISHLNDEIESCGNPDGNNEPITYGTMIGLLSAKAFIETAETADVQEVRHGHWFILEYEYFTCSECGYYHPNGCDTTKEAKERLADGRYPKYCSECGAKMDGKET